MMIIRKMIKKNDSNQTLKMSINQRIPTLFLANFSLKNSMKMNRLLSLYKSIIILLFVYSSIQGYCNGLKLLSVNVPTMVVMGESVWLNCSYDLENEELYSIKWYHWNADSEAKGEFYRWIPKDLPPGQMFQMEGIYLDLQRSSFGNVFLYKTDVYTDGSFRCEVSAEAPSFQTVRKEKELHIYSLPNGKPIIIQNNGNNNNQDNSNTTNNIYRPGDLINLTCRTMPSRPPAKLTWYINDEIADSRLIKSSSTDSSAKSDGLISSTSQLYFYSEPKHFSNNNGLLKIKCKSDIIMQYTVSSEELVIGGTINTNPNDYDNDDDDGANDDHNNGRLDQFNYQKHRQSTSHRMLTDSLIKDTPVIIGVTNQRYYKPGDIVNLTCISRAKPAPKLSFMVNDEEANPAQIREYPIFTLSDGSFASKLGLKFKVKQENIAVGQSLLNNNNKYNYYHQQQYSMSNRFNLNNNKNNNNQKSMIIATKQYRIKCLALMEENIYQNQNELIFSNSKLYQKQQQRKHQQQQQQRINTKHSSGLHFAENFAVNINDNVSSKLLLILLISLSTMIYYHCYCYCTPLLFNVFGAD